MTREELFHKNLALSREFDLYIIEHPEILDEIPNNARVVLLPQDDRELAEMNMKLLEETQQAGQPVVLIHLGKLKPLSSRITQFKMEIAANY